MPSEPIRVVIVDDADIVRARQQGRETAEKLGLTATESTLVATAISEIARNIMSHAGQGEIQIAMVNVDGTRGIEVVARDEGPGIPDIERAMQDGYSTGPGLGLGLPGASRLMDDFDVTTEVGVGTTVVMRKWRSK